MRCLYSDFSGWINCAWVSIQAFLFIMAIIFAVVVGGYLILSAQQRYSKYRFKKSKNTNFRIND